MRHLLVPVDGSENALRAVRYAISRAKLEGIVSVHLVTVHEEPVVYGEIEVYVSREKMAELQEQRCQAILEPAIALCEEAGVPHTHEVLIGHTAHEIARRAEELDCESIVMGTRGMTAIGNLVLGSVATRVIHVTGIPVTLVK